MDELESLIGKSISEIDEEIIKSLKSIDFKVAILEYKYKNCGQRYPIHPFKLDIIDYNNVISFDELIYFRKIFIFWHFKGQITDIEVFDITSDLDKLKADYDLIVSKIENNEAFNLRQGDTKYLAAKRLNETLVLNDKKVNKREFVLKKSYLQKILNEIKFNY
ncbi:hypothetical protein [Methanobrevibacter sp.]|uniref:hypothetical protein n=1 Tax=Methanobrevibacter sp. TaxID=66852 RepID=UPI00388F754A